MTTELEGDKLIEGEDKGNIGTVPMTLLSFTLNKDFIAQVAD